MAASELSLGHRVVDESAQSPQPTLCSGVERTFGWMVRWRRLVRDYEQRTDVSEAMIHVAMSDLLMRRLFR